MKDVLVVSGHPRLDDDSVANAAIVKELAKLETCSWKTRPTTSGTSSRSAG